MSFVGHSVDEALTSPFIPDAYPTNMCVSLIKKMPIFSAILTMPQIFKTI